MNSKPINCHELNSRFEISRFVKAIITHRFSGREEDIRQMKLSVLNRYRALSNKGELAFNATGIMSILEKMTIYEIDHLKSRMAKNFGISETEFNTLVSELKTHETAVFERVFVSHFSDCKRYLMHNYKALENDAYDATMDTLLEFRERLVDGKITYGNLRFLFTKMASQIYFRKMKSFKSQEIHENDILISEIEEFDQEDLLTLNRSWTKLGDNCKDLLKNHFYGNQKLTEIALEKGITSSTARKQKERCMNRLRLLFKQHTQHS